MPISHAFTYNFSFLASLKICNKNVNKFLTYYLDIWCYFLTVDSHWMMQIVTICNEKERRVSKDDKKFYIFRNFSLPCNILFMGLALRSSSFETDEIASSNNSSCSQHDQHSMETAFCPPLGEKITQSNLLYMGLKHIPDIRISNHPNYAKYFHNSTIMCDKLVR